MQFKDVIGHNNLKHKLIHAANEHRVSHAQLFVEREGYGALPLALAYAQFLNCENPTAEDSCGVCPSCVKYKHLVHPDLHFSLPVNSTKPKPITNWFIKDWREAALANPYITEQQWYEAIEIDNKQGIINVAEAESIIVKLAYKAYEGKFKVMVMWLPERMNTQAANKLLKLIEEPPQQTVFLLVTKNAGALLKTILSRTQQVMVPPIDAESLGEALKKSFGLDRSAALSVAHLSEGSYVEAVRLAGNGDENAEFFARFAALMRLAYTKKPENVLEMLRWAEEMAATGRERQKNFLLYAERLLRENFVLNRGVTQAVYLAGQEADFSVKFSPFINPKNIRRLYEEFNLALQHISGNGNPKIIFTDLSLKLMKLIGPRIV
jgi:DNA polymerase-3 subunit delta'